MRLIRVIGFQGIYSMMKDKMSFIWMLLVPCIYIFIFGSAFRGENNPSDSKAYLAVYNRDHGYLAAELLEGLKSENMRVDSLEAVPEEQPGRLLTIPENFTKNILQGKVDTLKFVRKPDMDLEAGMTVTMGIRKSYYIILAGLTELEMKGKRISAASLENLRTRPPLIQTTISYAGRHKIIPSGFNNQVPANIVQFTMMILFIFAGSTIMEERKKGLFRRIQIGPVHFYELFFGKLLYVFLVGLIQVAMLLVIGHFVFNVYYGSSPGALAILIIIYCLAIGSIGLCLGFFIKNEEKLLGIAITAALSMAALSGCWWPLEITPIWMQRLANFLPSGLALKAFHQLISYKRGFDAIWPNLLGLAGFAACFMILFARMIVRQNDK